jgi:hypothetical protein
MLGEHAELAQVFKGGAAAGFFRATFDLDGDAQASGRDAASRLNDWLACTVLACIYFPQP